MAKPLKKGRLIIQCIKNLGGDNVSTKDIKSKLQKAEPAEWKDKVVYSHIARLAKKGLIYCVGRGRYGIIKPQSPKTHVPTSRPIRTVSSVKEILYLSEEEHHAFGILFDEMTEVKTSKDRKEWRLVDPHEKIIQSFNGNDIKCNDFIAKLERLGIIQRTHRCPPNMQKPDREAYTFTVDAKRLDELIGEMRIIPDYPFKKEIPGMLETLEKDIQEKSKKLADLKEAMVGIEKEIGELAQSLEGDEKLLNAFKTFEELGSNQASRLAEIFRKVSVKGKA
ncbi:hypothetical protein KJ969_03970 [Patescibacteria group bacterium]|nr:hypothetical protein [Patescibacteria group bacterium]MBU1921822.1 hypothetical protein [Patescibacteria group bacterium]